MEEHPPCPRESAIKTPTLVMHRRDDQLVPFATGQWLASQIPNARFVPLEGTIHAEMLGDTAAVVSAVQDFLDSARPFRSIPSRRRSPHSSGEVTDTAVIQFTDIADSTAMTERLGDRVFRAKARELELALRSTIKEHGGRVIDAKTLGDGVLATFQSASQAIAAGLACAQAGRDLELPLHIGLHAGDVIRESDNVFGGAVNIAARVCAASAPDEVLVSDVVRSLARTSSNVTFEDRGDHEMKGVAELHRLYAVHGKSA